MELSNFFSPENWPVILLCAALITAAGIDFWKLKVPNWLTFPLILTGWLYAAVNGGFSGLGASLALTFFGLVLLLPVYAIGGMGAGDVKMQMGFGAWIGAIYAPQYGLWEAGKIVLFGFCLAAVIGGVIALGMILWRGDFRKNRQNVSAIVGDWFRSSSVHEVADKAAQRKPRMHLLPYGVPLCIGFISYLLLLWQPAL